MGSNPPHKWHFFFLEEPDEVLDQLQPGYRMTILRHLRKLVNADAPYELSFVDKLQGKQFSEMRKFRAGVYRVIFTLDTRSVVHEKTKYKGTVIIVAIDHRKDIYRP